MALSFSLLSEEIYLAGLIVSRREKIHCIIRGITLASQTPCIIKINTKCTSVGHGQLTHHLPKPAECQANKASCNDSSCFNILSEVNSTQLLQSKRRKDVSKCQVISCLEVLKSHLFTQCCFHRQESGKASHILSKAPEWT